MKKILFIILIAILMIPTGVMAQMVYVNSGKVIMDVRGGEGVGLPAAVVTSTKKYQGAAYDNPSVTSTLPSNLIAGTNTTNVSVYELLEIAPRDMSSTGSLVAAGSVGDDMNWVDAYTRCRNLTYNGTGWRLPTQRELMLLFIFKPAVDFLSGTAFAAATYWHGNEINAGFNLPINFTNGFTPSSAKTVSHKARCVRELP